jgi:ABC-type uncharacterized transport system fused permease/ATPase subunit
VKASTSDPTNLDHLIKLLTKELSATTIVSVAHRAELRVFHDCKITIERQRSGRRSQSTNTRSITNTSFEGPEV